MASSSTMLSAGIADVGCTFTLIYFAYIGDKILQPLLSWYFSIQYSSAPAIDPGVITWVYPIYYGMLLGMWFALQFAMYFVVISKIDYGYGTP